MNSKFNTMYALGKKEFMNKVRNKWILVLTLIFIGLILLVSAYGGLEARGDTEAEFRGFEFTIEIGQSMVIMLSSIVAIMLGYKAVVEEVESGNAGVLLTSSLHRKEIIISKFLGLAGVLSTSVIGGLGIGGLVIGFTAGFDGGLDYLYFVIISLLFSIAYLSIAIMISSIVKKKSRALAGGIFLWVYFNIIHELVLYGALFASGWSPEDVMDMGQWTFPDWYWYASLSSPNEIFFLGVSRIQETFEIPDMLKIPSISISLIVWIAVPLIISMLIFNRKDL